MGGGEREPVADAAATLIAAMQAGQVLMPHRDQQGSGFITGTRTGSQPPWNQQAADAFLVPHAGVRALEAEARAAVGSPVPRGGSDGNTRAAIDTLVSYARGADRHTEARWAADLEHMAQPALALPAVDRLPQWEVIWLPSGRAAPDCPYCGTANLRKNEALGIVACLFVNCPARRGGHRPWARVGRDKTGRVRWTWGDGTVQP
jgi:hypothetical protein